MNYSKPNLNNHTDSPKDWLASALIFSSALGKLLHENEGIVIELKNDMRSLLKTCEKVIVYKKENQIHIIEAEDELAVGQLVVMKE